MASASAALLNGRYVFGDLLGEGATATVSRAFDTLLQRDVAIKLLKPAVALDGTVVERFYAEARAAAGLLHPHVVGVYDVFSERTLHALVMEFVDGPSLASILLRERRLAPERAVAIARQIAQALAAAHARGIVHRDVKPANVLMAGGDVAKVADFGLAKAFASSDPGMTEAGRIVGSTQYFSPEQAQGLTLTPASDLYSLGVVLHHMLTGTLPFSGDTPLAIAIAHVTAAPPSEGTLVRSMPPALAAIVHRLLQKDPQARYASAADLDAALAAIQDAPAQYDPAWDTPTLLGAPIVASPPQRRRGAAVARALRDASARIAPALRVQSRRFVQVLAAWWTALRARAGAAVTWLRPQVHRLAAALEPLPFATKAMAGAGLVLLLFLTAIAMQPRTVRIADVRREPATRAEAQLRSAGLQPALVMRSDEAVPPGTVVAERPAAGTLTRRGGVVQLVVSSGAPMVIVPPVVGDDLAGAERAMLRSRVAARYAARISDAPPNTVIEQYPAPGTRVRIKSPALVVISAGPRPRIVHRYDGGDGEGGD